MGKATADALVHKVQTRDPLSPAGNKFLVAGRGGRGVIACANQSANIRRRQRSVRTVSMPGSPLRMPLRGTMPQAMLLLPVRSKAGQCDMPDQESRQLEREAAYGETNARANGLLRDVA